MSQNPYLMNEIAQGFDFNPGGAFFKGQQDRMGMIAAQYQQQLAQIQMAQMQQQQQRAQTLSQYGGQLAAGRGIPQGVGEALGPSGVLDFQSRLSPQPQPYEMAEYGVSPDGQPVVENVMVMPDGTRRVTNIKGIGGGGQDIDINMPQPMDGTGTFNTGPVLQQEYATIRGLANDARAVIPMLDRFEAINAMVNTGRLKPATTRAKQLIKSAGMDPETFGLTDDVASAEALTNLGLNFAMQFTAKTKGAVSDREMQMFIDASPTLANTPDGNKLIMNFMRRTANNQIAVNRMLAEHINKNGVWDTNLWEDELAEFHASNPVFSESDMKIIGLQGQSPPGVVLRYNPETGQLEPQ